MIIRATQLDAVIFSYFKQLLGIASLLLPFVRRSSDPQVAYAECEIENRIKVVTPFVPSLCSLFCVSNTVLLNLPPFQQQGSSGDAPSNNVCHDYDDDGGADR